MSRWLALFFGLCAIALPMLASAEIEQPAILKLRTRERVPVKPGAEEFKSIENTVSWAPRQTALVVVDMWHDHWCKGAAARVGELAGPMSKMIAEARRRGVLIVHCPSTCVDYYKDTPQRRLAKEAKFAETPKPLSTVERWGTAWCYPDKQREPELPIDDTDMGCDCATKCEIVPPWKRQIDTIEIADGDAITDNGQELYNLLAERGIENVIICGVHLNMCVLGRPFAIRQLVSLGKNVVLVRDMTDTMYNHEKRPFVDHFTGTDLVVEHVEKHWCPSILSTDLVGGEPFRFKEDKRTARR